jgi:hypothetical protein
MFILIWRRLVEAIAKRLAATAACEPPDTLSTLEWADLPAWHPDCREKPCGSPR